MKVIALEAGMGKTTELIGMADNHNGYIVCHSYEEAHRIAQQAKELGKHINFPISYSEFLGGKYYPPGVKCFYIDNAGALLQYISKVPVEAISLYCNKETV